MRLTYFISLNCIWYKKKLPLLVFMKQLGGGLSFFFLFRESRVEILVLCLKMLCCFDSWALHFALFFLWLFLTLQKGTPDTKALKGAVCKDCHFCPLWAAVKSHCYSEFQQLDYFLFWVCVDSLLLLFLDWVQKVSKVTRCTILWYKVGIQHWSG